MVWNNRWETQHEAEFGLDPWENEGGKVLDPYSFKPQNACEWEAPMPTLSLEDTKYKLTCLLANASRHVRKYFLKRTDIATQPTIAQQVGEFVTEIRRQLRSSGSVYGSTSSDLSDLDYIRVLTDAAAWDGVAVPSAINKYRWRVPYTTEHGTQYMDFATIQIIGENALKMAALEKTSEEEFREINSSLNNLLRETTTLDTLVSKARDLNNQAEVVIGNLCVIAESLK